MTIREAGKGIVRKSYGGRKNTYRIGFVNRDGEEDETELDAEDINDLAKLWSSLCPDPTASESPSPQIFPLQTE